MMKLRHLDTDSQGAVGGGWVKLQRSVQAEELLMIYPNAFMLLTQIAFRARRTSSDVAGLGPGEALIGDYKNAGLTERKYRTAKQALEKFHFATFRATSRGTIAKLIGTSIFDINIDTSDGLSDDQATDKRRTSDGQATTNKKEKKEKKESMKEGERPSIEDLRAFISKNGYNVNPEKWRAHYEANGWMVGRNKMRNWKAAVRTWHHGNFYDGGNGRCRSSLQVGAHPGQEAPTGPPSEYEVLTRMHTQTLREVNSLDSLLTDPTMRERYPGKISEWQAKRDKAQVELENLVKKLELQERAIEGEVVQVVEVAE